MSERTRGKETTLQFSEVGVGLLRGSFLKVANWKLSPDATTDDTQFCGEPEADYDIDHKGWKFSCTCHEVDPEIRRLYLRQIESSNAGLPRPRITIIATTRYRDGTTPPFVQRLGNVVLKLDDFDSDGGSFVKNTLSGMCKTAPEQSGTA